MGLWVCDFVVDFVGVCCLVVSIVCFGCFRLLVVLLIVVFGGLYFIFADLFVFCCCVDAG